MNWEYKWELASCALRFSLGEAEPGMQCTYCREDTRRRAGDLHREFVCKLCSLEAPRSTKGISTQRHLSIYLSIYLDTYLSLPRRPAQWGNILTLKPLHLSIYARISCSSFCLIPGYRESSNNIGQFSALLQHSSSTSLDST